MSLCNAENSIAVCGNNYCCKECISENCNIRCCDYQEQVECEYKIEVHPLHNN